MNSKVIDKSPICDIDQFLDGLYYLSTYSNHRPKLPFLFPELKIAKLSTACDVLCKINVD